MNLRRELYVTYLKLDNNGTPIRTRHVNKSCRRYLDQGLQGVEEPNSSFHHSITCIPGKHFSGLVNLSTVAKMPHTSHSML